MSRKVKIKLKQGKAKIKLKSENELLPLGSDDLRQLLDATLASALAAPPAPAISGLLTGPDQDRSE